MDKSEHWSLQEENVVLENFPSSRKSHPIKKKRVCRSLTVFCVKYIMEIFFIKKITSIHRKENFTRFLLVSRSFLQCIFFFWAI